MAQKKFTKLICGKNVKCRKADHEDEQKGERSSPIGNKVSEWNMGSDGNQVMVVRLWPFDQSAAFCKISFHILVDSIL